jgi:hypothetical protein
MIGVEGRLILQVKGEEKGGSYSKSTVQKLSST